MKNGGNWFFVVFLLLLAAAVSGCASKNGGVPIISATSQQQEFENRLEKVERNLSRIVGDAEVDPPGSGGRVVDTIVIHHTAGSASSDAERIIPAISRLHSRRFKSMPASLGLTVAYHYIIMSDGAVHQTRDEGVIGYHAGNWEVNKASIGICLVGNFEEYKPTQQQIRSLDALVRRIQRERNILKIVPHSHCKATLCCGKHLEAEIRKLPWGEHF